RVLIAARCELVAFPKPFLRQPRKNQRKPRCIQYLWVIGYFRIVDRFRDVLLRIRHHCFSTHFLSINARHATCFLEHLAGCLYESLNLLSDCPAHGRLSRIGAPTRLPVRRAPTRASSHSITSSAQASHRLSSGNARRARSCLTGVKCPLVCGDVFALEYPARE